MKKHHTHKSSEIRKIDKQKWWFACCEYIFHVFVLSRGGVTSIYNLGVTSWKFPSGIQRLRPKTRRAEEKLCRSTWGWKGRPVESTESTSEQPGTAKGASHGPTSCWWFTNPKANHRLDGAKHLVNNWSFHLPTSKRWISGFTINREKPQEPQLDGKFACDLLAPLGGA